MTILRPHGSRLKSALDAANEVLKNENALDTDIEAARTALETAVNGLVKRADFTKLQASVDEAKKKRTGIFQDIRKNPQRNTQALTAAETVLKNAMIHRQSRSGEDGS